MTGVELTDGRVIARTAVFIRPDNLPHADGPGDRFELRGQ
jgi:hypothetical protein